MQQSKAYNKVNAGFVSRSISTVRSSIRLTSTGSILPSSDCSPRGTKYTRSDEAANDSARIGRISVELSKDRAALAAQLLTRAAKQQRCAASAAPLFLLLYGKRG
ncbi:hypothetical protein BHM03_00003038 [Ensete ventricosum]|nr:hypothetical protein BHM03_00003038 [Ensete ventricosum]